MNIPHRISHIIIGDEPKKSDDNYLVDMPRQNPISEGAVKDGENLELSLPNLSDWLFTEDEDAHRPGRRLFTIA